MHDDAATPRRHDDTITGAGSAITYHQIRVTPPDDGAAAPFARLAIVHGYGDHAGRYVEVMTWLAARGVACQAIDLRGHGRSSGRKAYVRAWDEYLDDLRVFLAQPELRPDPSCPPLFLLAQSHGGLVVAAAGIRAMLHDAGVSGCILVGPYFVNALPVPRYKSAGASLLNVVCPWVRIASGIDPQMLSRDAQMTEDSRRDPLLLRCATPRWYVTQRRARVDTRRRAGEFKLPLLTLQGDADPIADPRGAAAFHAGAGSTDKTLITYPGFLHEPLREHDRERVFDDILAWLKSRARNELRRA